MGDKLVRMSILWAIACFACSSLTTYFMNGKITAISLITGAVGWTIAGFVFYRAMRNRKQTNAR